MTDDSKTTYEWSAKSFNIGHEGEKVVIWGRPFSIKLKTGEVLESKPLYGGHIIENIPADSDPRMTLANKGTR